MFKLSRVRGVLTALIVVFAGAPLGTQAAPADDAKATVQVTKTGVITFIMDQGADGWKFTHFIWGRTAQTP